MSVMPVTEVPEFALKESLATLKGKRRSEARRRRDKWFVEQCIDGHATYREVADATGWGMGAVAKVCTPLRAAVVPAEVPGASVLYRPDDEVKRHRTLADGAPVWFNVSRYERALAAAERLYIPGRRGEPMPFPLADFQHKLIHDGLGPVRGEHDLRRLTQRLLLSCARQNGKSEIAALFIVLFLVGPEAVPYSKVLGAAVTGKQAGLIYEKVERMLKLSDLQALVQFRRDRHQIRTLDTDIEYRVLSRNAGAEQGYGNTLFVCDELSQHPDDKIYETLNKAQGAFEEPFGIIVSTLSEIPDNPMGVLVDDADNARYGGSAYDPSWSYHIYTSDIDSPLDDREQWRKSNPNIGVSPSYDEMERLSREAMRMPSKRRSFNIYNRNQALGSDEGFVDLQKWRENARANLDPAAYEGRLCYGGLDLSRTTDLTSFALYFPGEPQSAAFTWNWMPEGRVEDLSRQDRAPYDEYLKAGYLEVTPGDAIDYSYVARRLEEICSRYRVHAIGYDKYYHDSLMYAARAENLRLPQMQEFYQSGQWMTSGISEFEGLVVRNELLHRGNPIDTRAAAYAVLKTMPNGSLMFDKAERGHKIDPVVAMVMAIGTWKHVPRVDTDFRAAAKRRLARRAARRMAR